MRIPRIIGASLLLALLILSCLGLAGCRIRGSDRSEAGDLATDPPIAVAPAEVSPTTWARRGEIIHEEDFDQLDSSLQTTAEHAIRAVYASVSAVDGSATEVSGAFFLPHGQPPPGGWPVVSLAHGTSGIGNNCGLSMQPDLLGYAGLLSRLLSSGFAVAMTDYQGLGARGIHPYLEPRTEAFNVIDAVRAMTRIYPSVSSRWVAFGISQGGQASWATDEFNEFYGGGLSLLGAVAVSPAADIVQIADLAHDDSLTAEQLSIFPLLIVGLARYNPDLVESKYLRGPAADTTDLLACPDGGDQPRKTPTAAQDVGPSNPDDTAILKTTLRKLALPQRALSVPLLVINGSRDELIQPAWVSKAIARSCLLGGQIEHHEIAGAGHSDLAIPSSVLSWIADRFAGKPASSNCPPVKR